jgi:phosphomevalonate kinase
VRVIAPGKLVLTGAYAVLEGAPAIVAAVDRYAVVDTQSPGKVDVRALHDEAGQKLGLGSSASSIVASFGARALARGDDPRHAAVRSEIFRAARDAHQRQQGGGSGVDIAASVHGGVLRYTVLRGASSSSSRASAPGDARLATATPQGSGAARRVETAIHAVDMPPGLVLAAFWSGTSARTSELLARVDALRARGGAVAVFTALRDVAEEAADAIGDASRFVARAAAFGRALAALGDAADAPIVPPAFAELAALAERQGAAFFPSGAGGGDVAVWLGVDPPSPAFTARATALALTPVSIAIDHGGVRPESRS